jgi:orotate phosphoribosyltransferase
MQAQLVSMLAAKSGHFVLESGHHGNLWLDLETLFSRPSDLRPHVEELAHRLSGHEFEAVCGPLVGGAFVAQTIASILDVEFYFTEQSKYPRPGGLFPVAYRLPAPLRDSVCGKRMAVINDVINAGSAVRGTIDDLETCGATIVAIGSLVVLGEAAAQFAAAKNQPLEYVASLENPLWEPANCPLCLAGLPVDGNVGD